MNTLVNCTKYTALGKKYNPSSSLLNAEKDVLFFTEKGYRVPKQTKS